MDFSGFMQRITFVADLDYIEIIPVAHRNVINFFGMRPRQDYMVWHHNKKSGEFSAIENSGLLIKWSTTTGQIMNYPKGDPNFPGKVVVPKVFDFNSAEIKGQEKNVKPLYTVFKGDDNDFTYHKGWQAREDYTLQLLVHTEPINKYFDAGLPKEKIKS